MITIADSDVRRRQPLDENLFFIVGCGRSGTSLLRAMISSHPDAVAINETQFCHTIHRKNQHSLRKLQGPAFVHQAVERMLSYWWIQEFRLDSQRLRELAIADGCTWPAIFRALLTLASEGSPVRAVGEKTPAHVLYLELLSAWFPKARFVHIVRDPRAVVHSFLNVPVGPNCVGPAIALWRGAVAQHFTWADKLGPDRYLLVKYEDLVSHPPMELEKACRLLRLEPAAEMLDYHTRTSRDLGISARKLGHQGDTLKPVYNSSVEKWRNKLSRRAIGMIECQCGSAMERLGYRLDHVKLGAASAHCLASNVAGGFDRALKKYRGWQQRHQASADVKS